MAIPEIGFLVGRILVGLYYVYGGYSHLTNKGLVGYAQMKKVPAAKWLVPLSGLLLLFGGLSVLLGFYPQWGVLALVLFLVPVTFKMHNFWSVPAEQKMAEQVNFFKNMALLGSALLLLAIQTPWPFSV